MITEYFRTSGAQFRSIGPSPDEQCRSIGPSPDELRQRDRHPARHLFSACAPKGLDAIAQGSALGLAVEPIRSPEGAKLPRRPVAIGCLLFLFFAGPANANAAPVVEASVQQPAMAVGQTNTYTIAIRNASRAPQLQPPSLAGLTFNQTPSTHNSIQFIDGVGSREIRFSWAFRAERAGRFVIPAREIQIDGQRVRVNEAVVEVGEMPAEMRDRFSLRWKVPNGPFYVGQAIPATLQLWVRAGVNAGLGSHPDGSSEQFIRTGFEGEPRQRQESVNGQPFVVVEWDTVITPIRSGSGDFPMSLVLVYETDQVHRDFFGSRRGQDQVQLRTRAYNWSVRDLPNTDRPPSFSGAVGKFDARARLSRQKLEVGDPVTFSLEVSGEGNFERIQAPDFPETDGWRIYPPRAQMKEEDVSYRGVKTFEYILTPTSETVREAPPIAFSWFDPEAASWREIEIAPETVQVQPGSAPQPRDRLAGKEPTSYPKLEDNILYPMATSIGSRGSLRLPWKQPGFWLINGGFGLALGFALFGIARQRKAAQNPYQQVRSEAARKAKDLATQAIEASELGDALTFYTQARQSLRHFLATLDPRSHNPESLTWDELEAILRKFSFEEDFLARARDLFGRKDAVQFAGWKPAGDELRNDRETFEMLLNRIVSHKR